MSLALEPPSACVAPETLRSRIYAKPRVCRADLSQLLRGAGGDSLPAYAQLAADVAVDLLVNQADPPKYVAAADADWLIGELCAGNLAYRARIKLLTEVFHYAVSVPPELIGACVNEIEKAIVTGCAGHPPGGVDEQDTAALRVAVFAAADGGALHVSRESAEALFRIAHAAKAVDPSFEDFFAKAVGNYLMGIAFRWTPSAAAEREKERWLNEKPRGFAAFLSNMFGGAVAGVDAATTLEADGCRLQEENAADEREVAVASEIDDSETNWLLAQLFRPGALTPGERALLAFLQRETPSLPAAVRERISE